MTVNTLWYLDENAPKAPVVYNYDPRTFEFISSENAYPSPLEYGKFLLPASATLTKVPDDYINNKVQNKTIVYDKNSDSWSRLDDYRGEEWYDKDGKSVTISEFGNPKDKGLFKEKPEIPEPDPTIDDLYRYSADCRWNKETSGITVGTYKVETDRTSQALLTGARVAANADPKFTTKYKMQDNQFVELDAKQIIAISDAVLAHVSNCFLLESQVNDKIKSKKLTTYKDVLAEYENVDK